VLTIDSYLQITQLMMTMMMMMMTMKTDFAWQRTFLAEECFSAKPEGTWLCFSASLGMSACRCGQCARQ